MAGRSGGKPSNFLLWILLAVGAGGITLAALVVIAAAVYFKTNIDANHVASNATTEAKTPTPTPTSQVKVKPVPKVDEGKKPVPVPRPHPPTISRAFSEIDVQSSAYWVADQFRTLEQAKLNEVLYPKVSDDFDQELNKLVGTGVRWKFPFQEAKSVDGGSKINLRRLQSPEGGSAFRNAITFRVVDVEGKLNDRPAKESSTSETESGVTVPASPDIVSLKDGDVILVTGKISNAIRRRSRRGDEYGIIFVLSEVSAEKVTQK